MSASSPTNLSAVRFRGSDPAGPRVVYLHGLTRGAMSVEPLLGYFGETWALDHAGHGASERLGRYRAADYAGPVIDWVSQNISEPFCFYGHSLGAMVAPLLAAALPERVSALVLEDPPFSFMGPRLRESDWYPYFERLRGLLGQWRRPEELGEVSYRGRDGREVKFKDTRSPEMLAKMAGFLGMADPRILDEVLAGSWLEGYEWPGLQHRCLVLQADGAKGGMLSEADAPAGARVVRLEGVGHLAHWQAPERVGELVREFLG